MESTRLERIAEDVYCLGPWGWAHTCVHFVGNGSTWVLVDTGWAEDGPRIRQAWQAIAPPCVVPSAIVVTHAHPDHAGSVRELATAWGCPVYLHRDELPIAAGDFEAMHGYAGPLDRWVVLPIMRRLSPARRQRTLDRSSFADLVDCLDADGRIPHLPGWTWLHTPGHTPGHVSLHRPDDGVLLTGDAVITLDVTSPRGLLGRGTGAYGPPGLTTWDPQAATDSITRLADLEPRVLAGGHGVPLIGPVAAAALRQLARQRHTPGRRRPH